jgi:hypothetical protein
LPVHRALVRGSVVRLAEEAEHGVLCTVRHLRLVQVDEPAAPEAAAA